MGDQVGGGTWLNHVEPPCRSAVQGGLQLPTGTVFPSQAMPPKAKLAPHMFGVPALRMGADDLDTVNLGK